MYYIIYKTVNLINGKYYIGKHQTENLNDGYLGSGKYLKKDIRKYGKVYFIKEVLFIFDNELEMNSKEKELVTESVVKDRKSYNLGVGGEGGPHFLGKFHSEETKNKLKKFNLGKKHSSLSKEKMSNFWKENSKGSKNSQYGTMWITNELDNKKIKKNDLDKWLSQGYTKGRKMYSLRGGAVV